MDEGWLWESAAELGRGIEGGAIDPRDLAETYLAAIAAHPDAQRIYARKTAERARAEASAAASRARSGTRRHPLDGVPLSWKDLVDSAGTATEAGSVLLRGRLPDRDAEVLARASRAGAVCLGKTHMTELAFSGLGINPVTATPPNINDPELAPGGSSSGAATSVAFGLAAAAIGSDTGGSVRVPAAWNDLVGLKTGAGTLPNAGVVPLCPRFDTIGPLCRSVEDAALILALLRGAPTAPDLTGASLGDLRLAVLEDPALPPVDPVPAAAFEAALERIAASGGLLGTMILPAVSHALDLSGCLFAGEAYGLWRDEIEARPDVMFGPVRERFRSGAGYSAPDFVAAWNRLDALRADWAEAAARFDAILMPSVSILPPRVAPLLADPAAFVTSNLHALRNTRIANLFGLCALTLPTATPSCGLMAMAPAGDEARLLRIGAALEMALAD